MKTIYLTGAILVLLVIGAVVFFSNKESIRTPDMQKTHVANTKVRPDNVLPEPAVDNAPASPVMSHRAAPVYMQRQNSYAGWYGSKQIRRKTTKQTKTIKLHPPMALGESERLLNANKVRLNATLNPDETSVASNRDYFGKWPYRTVITRPLVARRQGFRLWSRNVQFGPELGFNMNGFYNNQTSNMETGYMHAGIAVNIRMGNHFALQPVPRYIAKGNKRGDNMDAAVKEKLILHYASLPVNLVYKFGRPGNARVMIGAGPYVSYLAGVKHRYSNGADGFLDVVNPPVPAYSTSHIEDTDYGINGFMGIESPDGIYAKAGVEYGMKDIQRNPVTGINSDRNYSFLFSVGYLIGGVR